MSTEQNQHPLRLRKRHGSGQAPEVTLHDGARLIQAQSFRRAVMAGFIVIAIFSAFSITVSELTNRVFPWLVVVLGLLMGHAIRLAGRGTDRRFPLLAAILTLVGGIVSLFAVSASVSAEGFGIGTVEVLRSVTSMTWPVFFSEKLTVADAFFAAIAAALAAFYANRRLTRGQYHALRLWHTEREK